MTTATATRPSLTASREDLAEAVTRASAAIGKNPHNVIPILSNVKLTAEEGRLRIFATDLELSVSTSIAANISEPGAVAVEAELFRAALNGSDDTVHLEVDDRDFLSVACGTSKARIVARNAEDFPTEPDYRDEATEMTVDMTLMRRAASSVAYAASRKEDIRQNTTGVHAIFGKRSTRLFATDGHRLATIIAASERKTKEDLIVQFTPRFVRELSRFECDEAAMWVSHNHVAIEADGNAIIMRRSDIASPSIEFDKIGEAQSLSARADRQRMLAAVEYAEPFTLANTKLLVLTLDAGRLTVSATSFERGDGLAQIAIDYSGEKMEIGISALYLADALRAIADDQVEIGFASPQSLTQWRPTNRDEILTDEIHAIMPMVIK